MNTRQESARESHEVISRAVARRGVKHIARQMNISLALLYKWCEPHVSRNKKDVGGSGAANPLDRVEKLIRLTEGEEVLVWLCQKFNGFFTKNPMGRPNSQEELFGRIQKVVKEFSDTLDALSTSNEQGGSIDAGDSQRIRQEWDQLKSAGESLVVACESGHYRKKSKRNSGGK